MNAVAQLQELGVLVEVEGDMLHLRATTADGIPAQALELARELKPALLAELSPCHRVRERLLRIAEHHGIDAEIVRTIATDDALRFSVDLNDAQLSRWLNIVATRELSRRGQLTPGTWAIPSVAHLPTAEMKP